MAIEADIEGALLSRLGTLVLSPVLPVAYPSVKFEPVNGQAYLKASFFVVPAQRIMIASNGRHVHRGFLQVSVFYPSGTGELAARRIAGAVAAHFPVDARYSANGTTVRIYDQPTAASALDDAPWLNVPVTINWQAFA